MWAGVTCWVERAFSINLLRRGRDWNSGSNTWASRGEWYSCGIQVDPGFSFESRLRLRKVRAYYFSTILREQSLANIFAKVREEGVATNRNVVYVKGMAPWIIVTRKEQRGRGKGSKQPNSKGILSRGRKPSFTCTEYQWSYGRTNKSVSCCFSNRVFKYREFKTFFSFFFSQLWYIFSLTIFRILDAMFRAAMEPRIISKYSTLSLLNW